MLSLTSICQAFTEISWWAIPEGKERVIEFISEDINLHCHGGCQAYSVAGRPDEIYVLSVRNDTLKALLRGDSIKGLSPKVYLLDLNSRASTIIALDRFLKLDILFEDFPVHRIEQHPEIKFGGNPDGHQYVAPIQRKEKSFVATLSSVRKTTEKTTFGIPNIIPFFGRSKWFQKESSHDGTFFLEIFDTADPAKPFVQLQKEFKDLWLLPSVLETASWTQGAKDPILVVVDHENPIKKRKGRILVIRPR